MARLRIYGIARTRAFRVLWMAEELGLDYEHIAIETGSAGARQPGYLTVNPNGRLPAIDDAGFILWGVAGDQHLPRQEACDRHALSDNAGSRGQGDAMEPVGRQRDRAGHQCLVVPR